MDTKHFDKILERRIALTRKKLAAKGAEYDPPDNRLASFYRQAELNRVTPLQVAWTLAGKHIISIQDMVDADGDFALPRSGRDVWDEKLGDLINYCILMEALLTEKYGWGVSEDGHEKG